MTVSSLDQQALALLISLRDNPEIQKNSELFKMFSDTVSFALRSPPEQPLSSTHESSLIRIDTSGQDGEDGLPRPKAPDGSKGVSGHEGTDGENARDIDLQLKAVDELIIAQWGQGNASMKLGDPGNAVFLKAVGGGGGKGGRGGQGGIGPSGDDGNDATPYSSGSDGENGKPGRAGGNGGDGGNGGKGGDVKIFVNSEDSDLLMLLNSPAVEGGEKGRGGDGGKGGKGGEGGDGGSSYSGSVSRLQTRQGFNINGIRQKEVYTQLTPIFNVGGANGSQGKMGETGQVGVHGSSGRNGSFQMIVEGVAYSALYDLALTVSKNVDVTQGNPDGFYEPGEAVNLMVSVTNVGGMPTPNQEIEISLDSAPWMKLGTSYLILGAADYLPAGGSHTFATPFSFRIQHQYPCIGEPLNQQEALTYQALLRRVNKVFPRIQAQKDLLQIRYPVQISPLQASVASIFSDETILSLSVQNVASIVMGIAGPQKRRCFVTFEVEEKGSGVELVKIEDSDLQEPNKITSEVNLAPKSEKQLTVKCSLLDFQPKKVGVVASLFLDYFKDEQSQGSRCIQQRTIQIQSSSH